MQSYYFLFMPLQAFLYFAPFLCNFNNSVYAVASVLTFYHANLRILISYVQNCFVCIIQFWCARVDTFIVSLMQYFELRTQSLWILHIYLCHSEKDQVQLNYYYL